MLALLQSGIPTPVIKIPIEQLASPAVEVGTGTLGDIHVGPPNGWNSRGMHVNCTALTTI